MRSAAAPPAVRNRQQCRESPRVLFERLNAEQLDAARRSRRAGGVMHESLVC
jgi:hypothetical protein